MTQDGHDAVNKFGHTLFNGDFTPEERIEMVCAVMYCYVATESDEGRRHELLDDLVDLVKVLPYPGAL